MYTYQLLMRFLMLLLQPQVGDKVPRLSIHYVHICATSVVRRLTGGTQAIHRETSASDVIVQLYLVRFTFS